MNKLLTLFVAVLFATAAFAQTSQPSQKPPETQKPATTQAPAPPPFTDPATVRPKPHPDDVKSVDGIVAALYEVISGPPGPRDWDRLKSLLLPEARFMPVGHRPDGQDVYRAIDADGYIERSGPIFLKEGFFETGIANRVEQFGNIAHVFSTYEARHEKGGQPFIRGINSIQLVKLGDRWWVASIMWDTERRAMSIPEKYLK
jgi:hypothetical protein